MQKFGRVIREISITLIEIFLFTSFLDALVIFLIVFFVLALFNLYPFLAFIPSIVYLIMSVYVDIRRSKARVVESKYGFLREKLRTAIDNIKMDNPVVQELQEEIANDIRNVRVSSFVDTRKMYYKIFMTIIFSILIVIFATFNVTVIDMQGIINGNGNLIGSLNGLKGSQIYTQINESEDIYGKKSVVSLGDKELNIKIVPVNYKVSVREEGDIEEKDFDEIFPKDINVESATAYEENIPKEQQELVKNYFNKLAEG